VFLPHDWQASAAESTDSAIFCNHIHDMATMGLRKSLQTETHLNVESDRPLFVSKQKAGKSCQYFESLQRGWKESDGTLKVGGFFCRQAWTVVLQAISDEQNPSVLPKSRIAWDIVKLIDYLLPKDTAKGRQLSELQSRMLDQLLECESDLQHEAITWALETAQCLDSVLRIDFTKLNHVVGTLNICQLPPRTIQMLVQLPDYGDQSKAPAGLWQCWRQDPLLNCSGTSITNAIKYGLCPMDESAPTNIQDSHGCNVIATDERRLVFFQLHRVGWQESFSIPTLNFYPWRVAANECYIVACGTNTPSMTAKTGLFLWVWDAPTWKLMKQITCSSSIEVVLCGHSVAALPLCDQERYLSIYNIPTGRCEAVLPP
jgi:hypothetical protein